MKKLNNYIYSQLSISFFPIFGVLFIITSIVFLVKIASLTSVIKINFFELMQLFSYALPEILFYTLPVAFVSSCIVALSKLSSEYELIVITSFGLKPVGLLKILVPLTVLFSLILLIVSIGLIPKAKYLTSKMIHNKTIQANLNIKASEFGQKFGEWHVYIEKDEKNIYQDVKLFKKDKSNKDHFIIAKSATTSNEEGEINLILNNGKYIAIDDEVDQIDFKTMKINNSVTSDDMKDFKDTYTYWKDNIIVKNKRSIERFSFYTLASFLPVLSLFIILSFSYFNPRYEKNRGVTYAIIAIVVYYILASNLAKYMMFYSIGILPLLWLGITYVYFLKSVKRFY